jgi:hypothetical protein
MSDTRKKFEERVFLGAPTLVAFYHQRFNDRQRFFIFRFGLNHLGGEFGQEAPVLHHVDAARSGYGVCLGRDHVFHFPLSY